ALELRPVQHGAAAAALLPYALGHRTLAAIARQRAGTRVHDFLQPIHNANLNLKPGLVAPIELNRANPHGTTLCPLPLATTGSPLAGERAKGEGSRRLSLPTRHPHVAQVSVHPA